MILVNEQAYLLPPPQLLSMIEIIAGPDGQLVKEITEGPCGEWIEELAKKIKTASRPEEY